MSKTILTLDVGFVHTGYAVFQGGTCVMFGQTDKPASAKKRGIRVADNDAAHCAYLARTMGRLIKEHGISGVIGELPTGGSKSSRATACMSMAKGVVCAIVEAHGLPSEWVTPTEVKEAATGQKVATKDEIIEAMKKRYANYPLTEHEADAMAVYAAAENGTLIRLLAA